MPFVVETSESQKPFLAGCSASGAQLRRERRNVRRRQARARNQVVEAAPGSSPPESSALTFLADSTITSVSVAGTSPKTLCGSSCTTSVVAIAASQCPSDSQENNPGKTPISTEVRRSGQIFAKRRQLTSKGVANSR